MLYKADDFCRLLQSKMLQTGTAPGGCDRHSHDSNLACTCAHELQLAAARDKMAVVLRKTKNDDRLITALRAELAAAVQAGGSGRHIRASVTGVDRWGVDEGGHKKRDAHANSAVLVRNQISRNA
jgi:hypothetical protein